MPCVWLRYRSEEHSSPLPTPTPSSWDSWDPLCSSTLPTAVFFCCLSPLLLLLSKDPASHGGQSSVDASHSSPSIHCWAEPEFSRQRRDGAKQNNRLSYPCCVSTDSKACRDSTVSTRRDLGAVAGSSSSLPKCQPALQSSHN